MRLLYKINAHRYVISIFDYPFECPNEGYTFCHAMSRWRHLAKTYVSFIVTRLEVFNSVELRENSTVNMRELLLWIINQL